MNRQHIVKSIVNVFLVLICVACRSVFAAALVAVIASSCSSFSRNTPDKGLTKGFNDSDEVLPYLESELMSRFSIDTVRLSIGHGDNWAITWADDDRQYSFFTDGRVSGASGKM